MKRLFSIIIAGFALFSAFSTQITYSGNRGYTLVERTNLRRYINGKYSGLTSREVRSFISSSSAPVSNKVPSAWRRAQWYDGNFYVMEETLRNSKSVAAGIHEAIPSVFNIDSDGKMNMVVDNGYPTFRSFPSYTTQHLVPGDSWKAEATRAVDPLNKGVFTRMPIQVLYTFAGEEMYKDEEVYRIKALWQTNYGFSNFMRDPKGDDSLLKATGGHKADIIVRKSTGEAILIVDNVDEIFAYSDGLQINFKGTITLFTEYPPAVDRNKLLLFLNRVASVKTPSEKAVEKTVAAKDKTVPSGGSGSGNGKTDSAGVGKVSGNGKTGSAVGTVAGNGNTVAVTGSNLSKNGDSSAKNNLVVEETSAGLRLSIRDIKFLPDSDQVLASESARLDEIAQALKLAPENQFLIEGHTASVGKPAGEQKLSVERAQAIARELSKRGIPAEKFICKGWGGNKSVADNSTDSGRAQNRRVEITILE
ncbi:MAG: OmpA family protein [Treponema sp.]|nr:OmpA family protein [Candidatus Treponema equifaecale]